MTEEALAIEQPSDADMAAVGVHVGQILAGKYRIDRVLGLGGMGIVVKATHTILNTDVAVKFLLPEFVNDTRITSRFLREAKAVVSIKNPHVASVIDVGTLETGSPYIVMEYLKGRDLDDAIATEGCIVDFDRAANLLMQACEGLAAAHAVGIVHRDIKPGNLFLTRATDGSEQLKVLDFGISKNDQEVSGLTQTGTIMGSPMYMSPEQMRSTRNVDERTDIWSLGVVAFQMLTGRLPYEAESMTELVAMVIEHQPPRVSTIRVDVPEIFDAIIATALAKSVSERYPSVGHFTNDLAVMLGNPIALESAARTQRILANSDRSQSFQLEVPGSVARPGMGVSMIRERSVTGALSNTLAGDLPSAEAKRGTNFVVIGLMVLVLALGGVLFASSRQPAPSAAPRAPAPSTVVTQPAAVVPLPVEAAPVAPPPDVAEAPAPTAVESPVASDPVARAHSSRSSRAPGSTVMAPVTAGPSPTPMRAPAIDPFSDRN